MANERPGDSEYSLLSGFVDLVTSNSDYFRAYKVFFVVTTFESLAESNEPPEFFRLAAKARRKLLVEQDPMLMDAYMEIEVAFNDLGVDIKEARRVLAEIGSEVRVKQMRGLDPDIDGFGPSLN